MLEEESASLRYHLYNFLDKTDNFNFFGPNLPKTGFWDQNFKNLSQDSNQHPWDTKCTKFQAKQATLNFRAQIYPNWIVGSKFQKSKSRFRISILDILGVPNFRQNEQLWIFWPKFTQNRIFVSEFQKSKSGFTISILEILCAPIFEQERQLWIFGPKFAQKWVLESEFQKFKSGFGINTSHYTMCANFQSKWTIFNFTV